MTQPTKQALFTLIIWGIVTVAFIPIFFSRGGPLTYAQDKPRFVFVAILFGVGYISYLTMMFLTRSKGRADRIVRDERDEHIQRQSSGVALILVLVYVFFLCITLYEIYRESGCVPVSWMWFLGYTSVFWGYISNSALGLVLHSRMVGRGES
jgi:threonine/homoserine/homoserine lactone efflux protein